MLIVFTCVHYRLVRLEGSTTPQGYMGYIFWGISTSHFIIPFIGLFFNTFFEQFSKIFLFILYNMPTAAMRSFFMPGILTMYIQIPLPTKKEYRLLPILHIIILFVISNYTYHVVPD